MARSFFNAFTASLGLGLCLLAWRLGYEVSDWGALALLPLAWLFWVGSWPFFLDLWRAKISVIFQEGSILARIIKGGIHAFLMAIVFVPAATVLVAWQALTISPADAGLALGAVFATGLLFQILRRVLLRHLRPAFARNAAAVLATWSLGAVLTILLTLSFQARVAAQTDIPSSDLLAYIRIALRLAPDHGGWISEILAFPRAWDAAKLWLAFTLHDYPIVCWLVSLDGALYSLVLCRCAVVLTDWVALRRLPRMSAGAWFLATIAALGLAEVTALQLARQVPQTESRPETQVEQGLERLSAALTSAKKDAVDMVMAEIDPLLDQAFQPAFDAIPAYADFHYSLVGEYTELTAAVVGQMTGKLEEIVLAGLEPRLSAVGATLDKDLTEQFETRVSEMMSGAAESGIGEVYRLTMDDFQARMSFAVPIDAAASVGGALATKALAKVLAEKIAAKMALKLGVKAGGKLATTATGAGSGALICSWMGPGAALCGIVGGGVAWVASDVAMIKLDEAWSRGDFEADLRRMLEDRKAATRALFRRALLEKAKAIQETSDLAVQKQAMDLQEFSGQGKAATCKAAAELAALYRPLQSDLAARSGPAREALQKAMAVDADRLTLRPRVAEIEGNLSAAASVPVTHVLVTGALPPTDATGDPVSGVLVLNGQAFPIASTDATAGLDLRLSVSGSVVMDQPFIFALSLEQDDWGWNTFFGTGGQIATPTSRGMRPGLKQRLDFTLPIAAAPEASSVDEIGTIATSPDLMSFGLILEGAPLPNLAPISGCGPGADPP